MNGNGKRAVEEMTNLDDEEQRKARKKAKKEAKRLAKLAAAGVAEAEEGVAEMEEDGDEVRQ